MRSIEKDGQPNMLFTSWNRSNDVCYRTMLCLYV